MVGSTRNRDDEIFLDKIKKVISYKGLSSHISICQNLPFSEIKEPNHTDCL